MDGLLDVFITSIGATFGPIAAILITAKNLLIMLAAGVFMSAMKWAFGAFLERPVGRILLRFAPTLWCVLALLLPIGLAREGSTVGENIMLGIVLAAGNMLIYQWTVDTTRIVLGILRKRAESLAATAGPPSAVPPPQSPPPPSLVSDIDDQNERGSMP